MLDFHHSKNKTNLRFLVLKKYKKKNFGDPEVTDLFE